MSSNINTTKRITFKNSSTSICTCFTDVICKYCVCLSGCCDGNVRDINFSNKEFCKVCINTGKSKAFIKRVFYNQVRGCTCKTYSEMKANKCNSCYTASICQTVFTLRHMFTEGIQSAEYQEKYFAICMECNKRGIDINVM